MTPSNGVARTEPAAADTLSWGHSLKSFIHAVLQLTAVVFVADELRCTLDRAALRGNVGSRFLNNERTNGRELWGKMHEATPRDRSRGGGVNDVTPNAALTVQSTDVGLGITGMPPARDALIEAGLDLLVTPQTTLGVSYLGQIASTVLDHAKGQFAWRF